VARGRRGEPIFADNHDYIGFIGLPKDTLELWNLRVAAYCLMPNHYHIRTRRSVFDEPRDVAIYLTRRLRGDSLKQIGEQFQVRKYSSVSSVIEQRKQRW
jgi:hypothetical protein